MWGIAQTNAQTLPVTKRKKIHGPKNVQIHNLTRSNTLTSDCFSSSNFTNRKFSNNWILASWKQLNLCQLCQLCFILTFIARLGLSSLKIDVIFTEIK